VGGRSQEIAAEIGADVLACFPPGPEARPPAPVRYVVSAVTTAWVLATRRPGALIVTNPPIIPAILAVIYGRLTGATVVLDDHPGAFGAMGYRAGGWTEPIHKWLVRRARLCLVTEQTWVDSVESWGGRALVFHESPGRVRPVDYRPPPQVPRVLYVSTFARDEPSAEVLAAAARVPSMTIGVTGDPARRPAVEVPTNVELLGFLPQPAYLAAIEEADVVLALTTEPTSALRAAFEAVWAQRVLVVSDWPLARRLFPDAVHVENEPAAIAAGLERAIQEHDSIGRRAPQARERQMAEWNQQIQALRSALDLPPVS
jgi:hypothetical protein